MLTNGLRAKIILSLGVVIVVTAAMIALSATLFVGRQQIKALQSRSNAVAHSLSIQLERVANLGISVADIVGFDEQCREAVRAYPGMHYTQVITPEGKVLFDSRPGYTGRRIASSVLEATRPTGNSTPDATVEGDFIVTDPVRDASGRQIAAVVVAFPHSLIDKAMWRMLIQGGTVGALVGAFGLLLLYVFLRRQVVKPLASLARTMAHLRENPGDYSVRAQCDQNDEIGLLVSGFNQLLDRIEARERELIEARNTSDHANKLKSDFLAAMSHDLRTPMHAILSMNELLRSTPLTDKQARFSLNIQKAGQWLLGIINDILTFAKIESGKLELIHGEFDLRQLIGETVALQEDVAQGKKLQLTWHIAEDIPEKLIGDAPRLMQMLTNLISNALKFTTQGSVHVDVMRTHQHFSFSVTDTGVGIDQGKLSLLFEPFVQVASADALRRSGTGLGLSIVKQLAEAMGGEVGVDSSLQKGATFWFTAQLRSPADPQDAQIPQTILADSPVHQESALI